MYAHACVRCYYSSMSLYQATEKSFIFMKKVVDIFNYIVYHIKCRQRVYIVNIICIVANSNGKDFLMETKTTLYGSTCKLTFGDCLERVSNLKKFTATSDGLKTDEYIFTVDLSERVNAYGSYEFFGSYVDKDGKTRHFEVYYDGRDERTPRRLKLCVSDRVATEKGRYTFHKGWKLKHCYSFGYGKDGDITNAVIDCICVISQLLSTYADVIATEEATTEDVAI